MNKYKKLLSNTAIFAVGTFSSKILVFLLMPLYTRVLTESDYGVVDLLMQTGNLLLPLVSIGIVNAIVRFGLDKSYRKADVFSIGFLITAAGIVILLFCEPLLAMIPYFSGYTWLLCLFIAMSSMRSLCSQFVRAKGAVRLFAIDGILTTVTTILFNLLFLVALNWGITGYVLAIACSDFLSTLFLFVFGDLRRYLRFHGMKRATAKAMLRYCIPLIPATTFWWLTTVSDRYLVAYFLGSQANGLYAISYKIPTFVILISNIFIEAWQMSAVTEGNSSGRERFFTNVFRSYQSLVFAAASGLILMAKVITTILVSPSFYPSWQYIPFLVLATSFSCFVTFLGSIYMVEKKSVLHLITSGVGAVINIALNFVLIPIYGVNGAAFATFISYLCVFLLRVVDTRRFFKMRFGMGRIVFNTAILFCQSLLMIWETDLWILWEILLTALLLVFNLVGIVATIQKMISRRVRP